MGFWDDQVPSMIDPSKKFARKDYISLIDYHATLANTQSAANLKKQEACLAETKLLRDDIARLATLIADKLKGN